ncbi:MAG: protein-glutamate O-methyltransferase CheR, partial [Planctomycetota bacterium]
MIPSALARRLEERIGLDPNSLGTEAFRACVARRMRETGSEDATAYAERLARDENEIEEIIDALLVGETWFFRYADAFDHLAATARAFAEEKPGTMFRVLSAPCSTGEEAASIAITLLEAGLEPRYVSVEGVDLSRKALAKARRGVFGPSAFRGRSAASLEAWLGPAPGGWALHPTVAQRIRYRHANLVDGL